MQIEDTTVGSGNQVIDESHRRELMIKNAKSLGNSLGTANKKSLNMSNNYDKMQIGTQGID
jgi:hypothetical protein